MSTIGLAIDVEQRHQLMEFTVARFASNAQSEGLSQSSRIVRRGLTEQSLGEGLRGFHEGFVVERDQRLERRVGGSAFDAGEVGVGAIEGREIRMRSGSLEECVHAAAIAVLAGAVGPFEVASVAEVRDAGRQCGKNARPADLSRQQAGDVEAQVADDLGLDSQPILPREQRVLWIDIK